MIVKSLLALVLVLLIPVLAGAETLTWTDNSNNEAGFEVERANGPCEQTSPALTWAKIATTAANATTYVDSPATGQCYRVRAVNAGGASGYSNVAELAPGAPTNLTVKTP